jgi:phosphate/sulfate permease
LAFVRSPLILANYFTPLSKALNLGTLMHEEAKIIAQAIESLRSEPDPFKDYIFPIASAFFSAILGGAIAFFFFRHQEKISVEKSKMNTANKWTLLAEEARSNLISIKHNYHGILTEKPIQRALAIPSVLFSNQPVIESYADLSFIVPKAGSEKIGKWSQIPRIRAMIHNYNYLQGLWLKRNEVERPIKEAVITSYSDKAHVDVTLEEVVNCVGAVQFSTLVDLTEHVVKLTDDLLVELDSFLAEFPIYAKSLINHKKIKSYGSVLTYSNNGNMKLLAILRKSPQADYQSIVGLFGVSAEAMKSRYTTGYEEQI